MLPIPLIPPASPAVNLLVLNDYSVARPMGGGAFRIFHLYSRLAETYSITLLCLSDRPEYEETPLRPGFLQVAVPKNAAHRTMERQLNRLFPVPGSDIVSALSCMENDGLVKQFRLLAAAAAVIICEQPYLSPLLALVPSSTPIVYMAQNVELQIKRLILAGHPVAAELLEAVSAVEGFACGVADAVVAVCPEDAAALAALSRSSNIRIIRNGACLANPPSEMSQGKGRPSEYRTAAFVGSGHQPNVESARFLIEQVAPRLPGVTFRIVGLVCDAFAGKPLPSNVVLFHFLNDAEKNELLRRTGVGLNPMFSGGGSNLKIGEYFAAGLPVLSTQVGARGYDVLDGRHIALAEADSFATRLQELLGNPDVCSHLAAAAYAYAREHLDWNVLAGMLCQVVEEVRQ